MLAAPSSGPAATVSTRWELAGLLGAGMGATVVLPTTTVGGTRVTVAWLRDPQGNLIGLVKAREP